MPAFAQTDNGALIRSLLQQLVQLQTQLQTLLLQLLTQRSASGLPTVPAPQPIPWPDEIPVTTNLPLIVISPNGGETWSIGSLVTVKFAVSSPKEKFNVYLVKDGTGCFMGTVPVSANRYAYSREYSFILSSGMGNNCTINPGQYRIHVTRWSDSTGNDFNVEDFSDNYFTISTSTSTSSVLLELAPIFKVTGITATRSRTDGVMIGWTQSRFLTQPATFFVYRCSISNTNSCVEISPRGGLLAQGYFFDTGAMANVDYYYAINTIIGNKMESGLAISTTAIGRRMADFINPAISNVILDKNSYRVGDRYTITWMIASVPPVVNKPNVSIGLLNETIHTPVYNLAVGTDAREGINSYSGVIPAGVGDISSTVSTGRYYFNVRLIATNYGQDGTSEVASGRGQILIPISK